METPTATAKLIAGPDLTKTEGRGKAKTTIHYNLYGYVLRYIECRHRYVLAPKFDTEEEATEHAAWAALNTFCPRCDEDNVRIKTVLAAKLREEREETEEQ